jgi:hypothetical protein
MGITLATLADLLENEHGLSVYCTRCQRWAELDLHQLVRQGYGSRKLLTFRPRCRACDTRGEIQVRPPVPTWPSGTMYIAPKRDPGP